jgi:transposase
LAKLRQFRAMATRYGKRERICQGTIDVASVSIWLRDRVP